MARQRRRIRRQAQQDPINVLDRGFKSAQLALLMFTIDSAVHRVARVVVRRHHLNLQGNHDSSLWLATRWSPDIETLREAGNQGRLGPLAKRGAQVVLPHLLHPSHSGHDRNRIAVVYRIVYRTGN